MEKFYRKIKFQGKDKYVGVTTKELLVAVCELIEDLEWRVERLEEEV